MPCSTVDFVAWIDRMTKKNLLQKLAPSLRQYTLWILVYCLPDSKPCSRPRGRPPTKKVMGSSEFVDDEADDV